MSTPILSPLSQSISAVQERLTRQYITCFPTQCCVRPPAEEPGMQTRLIRITKLAFSEECVRQRLVSVYQSAASLSSSCFMLLQGTPTDTELYLGIRSQSASAAMETLTHSLRGSFPGISMELLTEQQRNTVMDRIPESPLPYRSKAAALLSVVPSLRTPDVPERDSENVQGLEKFIDAMQGETYTVMILATPYDPDQIQARITALEEIASSLSSMEQLSLQHSTTQSAAYSDSESRSIADTINLSLSSGYSTAVTDGSFRQSGRSSGTSISPFGFGINRGTQTGSGVSSSESNTASATLQSGSSFQKSLSRTRGVVLTGAEGESVTSLHRNISVINLIEQLQRQIRRLRDGGAYGLWDCCAYFLAPQSHVAISAASQYQSLVSGQNTSIERSVTALWQPVSASGSAEQRSSIKNLLESLREGIPPRFVPNERKDLTLCTDTVITGSELPILMGLPLHSAGSLTVQHMAAFGRQIHLKDASVPPDPMRIGQVLHMGTVQPDPVWIDPARFTGHSSIFGYTGSGKSTVCCGVLDHLHQSGIPFTIIEPAKGEYQAIWRKLPGVEIFTTLPNMGRMLRLNPFAFEPDVHAFTHVEHLISVFQVCWPLYAAQPAVLRDSILRAYRACGWDLENSIYLGSGSPRFPTFSQVVQMVPLVVRESRFVGEARGNYEGGLYTRLSMLTKGLFGELLNQEMDIPVEELFDETTVIDLSHVGSQEVLALMIGVLLIRLYEHRMTAGAHAFQHLTVLEEAHNILPRVSPTVDPENGGASVSKSVEVLTKCIAELRFSGEGFMLCDQSPNAVDVAAIRNTSTKLIMGLHSTDDVQAAADSIALTPEQQSEIPRLSTGCAIVYQDGWIEPVLSKLDYRPMRWREDHDLRISQSNMALIRTYLAEKILTMTGKDFDPELLEQAITGIQGLDRWKRRDYLSQIRYFRQLELDRKADFSGPKPMAPFYGMLLRDLLGLRSLFEVHPLPVPDPKAPKPYHEDAAYRSTCVKWMEEVLRCLSIYCPGLTREQTRKMLHYLLFAQAETHPVAYIVIRVLF